MISGLSLGRSLCRCGCGGTFDKLRNEFLKVLIDGSTDITDSSRFIKDKEVKLAVEKGRYFVPFAVTYGCIVPVVHTSNTVADLTLDRLKTIYKGEIVRHGKWDGGTKEHDFLGVWGGFPLYLYANDTVDHIAVDRSALLQ